MQSSDPSNSSDTSDTSYTSDTSTHRDIDDEPIPCKMCGKNIPENCPTLSQGYCDCLKAFTRLGEDELRGQGKDPALVQQQIFDSNSRNKQRTRKQSKRPNGTSKGDKKRLAKTQPTSKTTVGNNTTHPHSHDSTTSTEVKCYKCHFFGHLAKDCTTKICDYCKGRRHTTEQCKKNPDNYCTKCTYFGHNADNCQTKVCSECGKNGHDQETCWKLIKCDRCGLQGHPSDKCRQKCQRCNRSGHQESECTKEITCWICKEENQHTAFNCPEQKNIECQDCGEYGHHARFCKSEYIHKTSRHRSNLQPLSDFSTLK